MASIARRIRRTYLLISALIIGLMGCLTVLMSEDLESTLLQLDFASDRDFFSQHLAETDRPMYWESALLKVFYLPLSSPETNLPDLFRGMKQPFSGETSQGGRVFLVEVGVVGGGVLYMARDITHIEDREVLFVSVLAAAGVFLFGLSLLLSFLESRRLVRPLQQLSESIQAIPIGSRMPLLSEALRDIELRRIAQTFNTFLKEMEAFVRREKGLVGLASHELRTPIAVVSGALDVLEERNRLDPRDAATLARIRSAVQEMEENVAALLLLSRRAADAVVETEVDVPGLVEEVVEDLAISFPVFERVDLDIRDAVRVRGDSRLIKMLLRNLIQNALQHTSGEVRVQVDAMQMTIVDQGGGSHSGLFWLRAGDPWQGNEAIGSGGGLGLYIANLICDRLGWRLHWHSEAGSTRIEVRFAESARAASATLESRES